MKRWICVRETLGSETWLTTPPRGRGRDPGQVMSAGRTGPARTFVVKHETRDRRGAGTESHGGRRILTLESS